ncbi:MAG: T9SS type A sorting domain-containing protein, partial [Saprospiraceae bacterium]
DDLLDCNEDGPAACTNFESELKFSVVAGQTYMMRLGGFGSEEPGAQGSGSFTLTEAPAGPPNNDCADAIPVSLGEDQPVSNISATTDGPTHPNDQICFGFGDNTCQNDIWYTFLSPVTGTILWSTCDQVNWDARLVVYGPNVSCAEASPDNMIGCSDATPGCANFTNILYFDVEEGETYLLRIGGYNGATGAGVFDLVEVIPPEPPANDLCENADTAWVMTAAQADDFEFIFEGTIINSTVSDGVVDPSCGGGTGGEYPDVWYKFNSVGNEMIELRYTAQIEGTGFYLEIFENCGGDTLQPESACFSFTPDDTGFKTDTIFGLPPTPTEFYIRVSGSLFWTPGVFFFQPVAEIIVDADEASFPGEAKIYPNPANIALHLDFRLTKSASSEAYILNSLGQVLYHEDLGFLSQGTHHHSFDMNKLPPGIYHLVVKADGAKKVLRFAKQ